MGVKLRTFECIKTYRDGTIPKGTILEVFGSSFKMNNKIVSYIKSYHDLYCQLHNWKETTLNKNI